MEGRIEMKEAPDFTELLTLTPTYEVWEAWLLSKGGVIDIQTYNRPVFHHPKGRLIGNFQRYWYSVEVTLEMPTEPYSYEELERPMYVVAKLSVEADTAFNALQECVRRMSTPGLARIDIRSRGEY